MYLKVFYIAFGLHLKSVSTELHYMKLYINTLLPILTLYGRHSTIGSSYVKHTGNSLANIEKRIHISNVLGFFVFARQLHFHDKYKQLGQQEKSSIRKISLQNKFDLLKSSKWQVGDEQEESVPGQKAERNTSQKA